MSTHPKADPERVLADLLEAAVATPAGPERTAALARLDRAFHGPTGATRALRKARSKDLTDRIAAGARKAALARELGVSSSRVDQLAGGNAGLLEQRKAARARAGQERASVRDEVAAATAAVRAQVLVAREAERARLGAEYLERLEGGEPLVDLAAEAGVSRQQMAAWLAAARAERDTQPEAGC